MPLLFVGSRMPDSGSLVGDQLLLKHKEASDANFAVASPSVTVVGPSGAATPSVSVVPGGTANPQILEAVVNEAVGGVYKAMWSMQADGQTLLRQELYFVAWTDIYTQVRSLLHATPAVVTNADVDSLVSQELANILSVYSAELDSYSDIPDGDRLVFDQALSYLAAAFMRPFTPKEVAVGDVTKFQSGNDMYSWTAPKRSLDEPSIEEAWIQRAYMLLDTTDAIGGAWRTLQDKAQVFAASGRRRNQPQPMQIGPRGQVRFNQLFIRWTTWLGEGSRHPWSWGARKW